MKIWDVDQLVLFIMFVIPGFISLKVYDLLAYRHKEKTTDVIIDAVAYSSLNYALLSAPIWLIEYFNVRSNYPIWYSIFYACVLFLFPMLWAYLWHKLRNSQMFQNKMKHPIDKPWDYLFSQRKAYWIKITLKDDTVVGGRYAESSFASSSPAKEQIYLEESWIMKESGGFERPKERTEGILISDDEIKFLEFFTYEENSDE